MRSRLRRAEIVLSSQGRCCRRARLHIRSSNPEGQRLSGRLLIFPETHGVTSRPLRWRVRDKHPAVRSKWSHEEPVSLLTRIKAPQRLIVARPVEPIELFSTRCKHPAGDRYRPKQETVLRGSPTVVRINTARLVRRSQRHLGL